MAKKSTAKAAKAPKAKAGGTKRQALTDKLARLEAARVATQAKLDGLPPA
jgi:hypothetical protein